MSRKNITYQEKLLDIFKRLLISLFLTILFVIIVFLFITLMQYSGAFIKNLLNSLVEKYNLPDIIYYIFRIIGILFVIGFNGICIFMTGYIYGGSINDLWWKYGSHA